MGVGVEEHDKEGRLITAEYETFYFVGSCKAGIDFLSFTDAVRLYGIDYVDVPNAGRGLPR